MLAALALLGACSGDDTASGGTGGASGSSGSGGVAGSSGASGSAGTAGASGGAGTAGASGGAGTAGASGGAGTAGAAGGSGSPGELPSVGGCALFTADDAWNVDISGAPVDADWTSRVMNMAGSVNLHPDYGNWGAEHYGIPFNVVPASQPAVDVSFDWYPDESDPGPYPFPDPSVARIEGGTPDQCDGDCHLLVVQEGACMLYEGYACSYQGGWHCGNGASWDLGKNSYGQRPKGWTSADAAGLAILPGLVRYDEVQAGAVRHAIRFTLECTRPNYVAPATHHAVPGACDPADPNSPPMGLRLRLAASYDISGLSPTAQVVATAMKKYGFILADNGSNFYFQGEDHPGWTEDDVEPLKTIPASAFEAIVPPPLEP
jgi:hypothetical protein